MTNAQTTLQPQTSREYWQTIESINETLAETIAMASDDFLNMCTLLKKCNVKSDDLNAEISAAVRELQHIDFFRQKLGHVCDLHLDLSNQNDTKTIGIDLENKYAIHGLAFRINYHQLLAAHEDYIKVILSVQSTIRKIKEHNVLLINFSTPIFPNRFQIDDNFRNLNISLGLLADKYYYANSGSVDVFVNQVLAKYTMESERVVLNWCVNHVGGSEDEFMNHYKASNLADQIELF